MKIRAATKDDHAGREIIPTMVRACSEQARRPRLAKVGPFYGDPSLIGFVGEVQKVPGHGFAVALFGRAPRGNGPAILATAVRATFAEAVAVREEAVSDLIQFYQSPPGAISRRPSSGAALPVAGVEYHSGLNDHGLGRSQWTGGVESRHARATALMQRPAW